MYSTVLGIEVSMHTQTAQQMPTLGRRTWNKGTLNAQTGAVFRFHLSHPIRRVQLISARRAREGMLMAPTIFVCQAIQK